jgi:RNA polymerase-binding transcription factor DksA
MATMVKVEVASAKPRADDADRKWPAAVLNRSRDVQAAVEEALRRLATGEYGLCVEWGQHIAVARLRALPFAVRCLACQERFEHEEEGGRAPVTRHGGSGLSHDEPPLGPRRTMTAPTRNGR